MTAADLQERIDGLSAESDLGRSPENLDLLREFRAALNRGEIRVAEPAGKDWKVNEWVRRGVILHVRLGLMQQSDPEKPSFIDYDTMPLRGFLPEDNVRTVVGAVVRDGAYLGQGVQCLAPVMVNLGSWIGERSLIDSNTMIGACAQVGARVTVSCGSQIGGVVLPLDRLPNIIEDDVVIGGNCGVFDGVIVRRGAMIAGGVQLYGSSLVFDATSGETLRRRGKEPLRIPENAVVVPGARAIQKGPLAGREVYVTAPVIAAYREEGQDPAELLAGLLG